MTTKTKKTASANADRAVVVCTAKRAVVFGYTRETDDEIITRGTVTLERARMCVYWSAATKGVMGLAAEGPQSGSRIGPSVPSITLENVTAIMTCATPAANQWELGKWD